jgi:hypothetical protein
LHDAQPSPLPPPPSRPSAWLVAGLMISALAVIGVGAWVGWTMTQGDGPSYPVAWDPRVAEIADFVEQERGLEFLTPVHVDFLGEDDYRERVTTSADALTDDDREALDEYAAMLRALGLVQGDLDVFEEQNTLYGEGTLAFYDPADKRVVVKGTDLGPRARRTIAHELTHALQDQHFDLGKLADEAGDDGQLVYRSLIEGDASNVDDAYVQQELTEAERAEVGEEDVADSETAYADLEPALVALFAAPYALGPSFVAVLPDGKLDDLLRSGVPTEAVLFDPTRLDEDRADIEPPPTPEVSDDQTLVDEGSFGVFAWYVTLASRVDPRDALGVVDEWESDSYVTYLDGDTMCVTARFRGATDDDTDAMAALLEQWATTMPEGSASITDHPDFVELNSCDPGSDGGVEAENDAIESLQYPAGRLAYAAQLLEQAGRGGASRSTRDRAWCVADAIFDEFSLEELAATEADPDLVARAEAATASCLTGG